jgi:hypothetical protein
MGNYGKGISVAEGNDLLTSMMTIRQRFDGDIDRMTKKDTEANRYFCGGDALYIFGKDSLATLWNRSAAPDSDCIFAVFPASRTDEPGRPTLMVFIYQKEADGQFHLVHDLKSVDDGLEHPGGNGAFTLEKSKATGLYEIPETIDPQKIQFAFGQ